MTKATTIRRKNADERTAGFKSSARRAYADSRLRSCAQPLVRSTPRVQPALFCLACLPVGMLKLSQKPRGGHTKRRRTKRGHDEVWSCDKMGLDNMGVDDSPQIGFYVKSAARARFGEFRLARTDINRIVHHIICCASSCSSSRRFATTIDISCKDHPPTHHPPYQPLRLLFPGETTRNPPIRDNTTPGSGGKGASRDQILFVPERGTGEQTRIPPSCPGDRPPRAGPAIPHNFRISQGPKDGPQDLDHERRRQRRSL